MTRIIGYKVQVPLSQNLNILELGALLASLHAEPHYLPGDFELDTDYLRKM